MAEEVGRFLQTCSSRTVRLLDVGVHSGVSRRYIERQPRADRIEYHGVDVFPKGPEFVYKHDQWHLKFANLEFGLPQIANESYDIILCEQVLEHLHNVELVLEELARILRPGGLMILGVPIFPPGIAALRRNWVPRIDRWSGHHPRSHVQAWSLSEFRALVERVTGFVPHDARGYRFISGGVLRPLEHLRWWYRLNRALGARLPSLCIEAQLLLSRPAAESPDRECAEPVGVHLQERGGTSLFRSR
jgi:2-polyprenyl-3-methyl-5-hydroxy-6-metoxy-1,4-benzoquinol methylase